MLFQQAFGGECEFRGLSARFTAVKIRNFHDQPEFTLTMTLKPVILSILHYLHYDHYIHTQDAKRAPNTNRSLCLCLYLIVGNFSAD